MTRQDLGRLSERAVLTVVSLWAIGAVVVRALPGDGAVPAVFGPWLAVAVTLGAAGLVAARARSGGPVAAYLGVAAGLGLWALGDVLTLSSPVQGIAAAVAHQAVYVLALLTLGAGLALSVHRRGVPRCRTLRLDVLTTGLAVAALVTWLGVDPVRRVLVAGDSNLVSALQITTVVLEALLVVLAVMGQAVRRWRPDAGSALALAAAASFLVGEAGYVLTTAAGTWSPATITNTGWSGAAVLLAWAARANRPAVAAQPEDDGLRDILLPFVFALASVGLLAASGWLGLGPAPVALAAAALVTALVRLMLTALEHSTHLSASRIEASTDPLTGLGNRRRLTADLEAALARPEAPTALVLFDVDGFKAYNDRHGHPAGDALLIALGGELAAQVGAGRAYRLGGDELCALVSAQVGGIDRAVAAAAAVVGDAAERGGCGASHGAVVLHAEAADAAEALRIADRRLYGDKGRRRRRGPVAA